MLCHRFFRSHAITFTATGLTGYHHLAAIIHKDFNWPATNDFATLCHPQCKRIRENSTMQVQGVLQWASNRFISVLLNKLCLCLHNDWNWPWALRNWKRFKLSCQRRTCCAEIGSARKWHPGAATGRFHRSTKGWRISYKPHGNNIGLSEKRANPDFQGLKPEVLPFKRQ